ncbi:hypothetical protein GCM10023324_39260 [Streptomyces youssoufiensis]
MESGAAEGGAQGGGVDGDHGLEAGFAVLAEHDLLVAALFRLEEHGERIARTHGRAVDADGMTYVSHGGDSHMSRWMPSGGWGRAGRQERKTWGAGGWAQCGGSLTRGRWAWDDASDREARYDAPRRPTPAMRERA